ncbi:MAG: hypothetical protein IPM79_17185 [Polyangiaceae bacterium]|jgi:hypothetical protein|nr:hypothetical protein [Polyangiaceae bacterium]MBK8939305.1 hypothetical protein [Polyangiaceae bacterium]
MSTKFADFIQEKKLDRRRILAVSAKLERLRPADRAIKLSKRTAKAKAAAGGEEAKNAAPASKPRSGRAITPRAIDAAIAGKSLTGPQKTRLLRAVNALLEQKKAGAVELTTLF